MKNTLKAILSILVGVTMCSLPVNALADDFNWYDKWYFSYKNDSFTVTTDNFHYSTSIYGITLENELIDANFMVNGIIRNTDGSVKCLVLTEINKRWGDRGITIFSDEHFENYDGETVQVGDFLKLSNGIAITTSPPEISAEKVEYLGHGTDIFGEEFQKVIRHEWIGNISATDEAVGFDTIMGDTTEDEKVDILDVITINRSIVGKTSLNSYSQYVSDVNGDGIIDGMDSMNIMRYIVGLIDSPDAQ